MDELSEPAEPRLSFEVLSEAGSPLVKLAGELDIATTEDLEAAVAGVVDGGPERVIVDARDLRFADSSAIALWVRWANVVGEVEIREPPELIRRVITRMGLAERIRLVP